MKSTWRTNRLSFLACLLVILVFVLYRVNYIESKPDKPFTATTWDALGYYMYLPSVLIYQDATQLKWFPDIEKKYQVTGGKLYQANKYENGNYVFKYLGGVAIMQLPFFLVGHAVALNTNYPADGFSKPYQFAVVFGAIIWFIIALFVLRGLLVRYFKDEAVAAGLLLLGLASNLIQYVSVDSSMSHAFIFPLYAFVLYTTIRWHKTPSFLWAALTGLVIGLATISRPTEAIMLFIPLLWDTHTREAAGAKWKKVREKLSHVFGTIFFCFVGVLPQLIYWKIASGSFVYNVGSKWYFLTPFFRVLFGFENGWFVYTPVAILFVAGLFFIKKYPFRKSFVTFCLLNIWIIIAWADWKYGGTYSTRALVQSYPVFAFPLVAITERIISTKWKYLFYLIGIYLIGVNLFQVWQYNRTIIHYRDMNRQYYTHVYLNPNPQPLDISLLDTREYLYEPENYKEHEIASFDTVKKINQGENPNFKILEAQLDENPKPQWIKVEASLNAYKGYYNGFLCCELSGGGMTKLSKVRLFNPISEAKAFNDYAFFIEVPEKNSWETVSVFIQADGGFDGTVRQCKIIAFRHN